MAPTAIPAMRLTPPDRAGSTRPAGASEARLPSLSACAALIYLSNRWTRRCMRLSLFEFGASAVLVGVSFVGKAAKLGRLRKPPRKLSQKTKGPQVFFPEFRWLVLLHPSLIHHRTSIQVFSDDDSAIRSARAGGSVGLPVPYRTFAAVAVRVRDSYRTRTGTVLVLYFFVTRTLSKSSTYNTSTVMYCTVLGYRA